MSMMIRASTVEDRDANARRRFLRNAGRMAVAGGVLALAACGNEDSPLVNTPTPTPTGSPTPTATSTATPAVLDVTDTDLLVFTLQLHYLQAEFYSRAMLGAPLPAALVSGPQAAGDVSGPRQVGFGDAILLDQLREIAIDKINQVARLRAALGSAVVARPALDLSVGDTGPFTVLARAAGEVAAPAILDVYATPDLFLLGAFVIEDTLVAAYKGSIAIYQSAQNIALCSGLMATSAHHTAIIRSQLYLRGGATGSRLRAQTIRLSDQRDLYAPVDDDQGVSGGTAASPNTTANVTNADGEGITYGRLPQLTINTVYQTRSEVEAGGFFPAGLTGRIRRSAAT